MAEERNAGNRMFGLNSASRFPGSGSRQEAESESPAQVPAPPVYEAPERPRGSRNWGLWIAVVVLLILTGTNLYLELTARQQAALSDAKQADETSLLTKRLDMSDQRYADLRAKFEVTTQRLGLTQQELSQARQLASKIQKQQQDSVQALNNAIQQKASAEDMQKLQSDANAKFTGVNSDIEGLNKKLGETNDALSGTKGELSGAIARTHDELVALAHRTDRDYYEFNLAGRGRQKVGTITLELTKTNTKRNTYNLNLYFDDKRTERKDLAIDSPVFFYVQGAPSALELVVNKLQKNSVTGYVSAPKGFFPNTPNVLAARPGT